jgi:hypothetical protein
MTGYRRNEQREDKEEHNWKRRSDKSGNENVKTYRIYDGEQSVNERPPREDGEV